MKSSVDATPKSQTNDVIRLKEELPIFCGVKTLSKL